MHVENSIKKKQIEKKKGEVCKKMPIRPTSQEF